MDFKLITVLIICCASHLTTGLASRLPAPRSYTNIKRGLDLGDYSQEYSYSYASTDFEAKHNNRVKHVTVVKNHMSPILNKINKIENHMVINMPTPAPTKSDVAETIEYWPQKGQDTKIIRKPAHSQPQPNGKESEESDEFKFDFNEPSQMKKSPEEFVLTNSDSMYKLGFPNKAKEHYGDSFPGVSFQQSIEHPIPKNEKHKSKESPWSEVNFNFNQPKEQAEKVPEKPTTSAPYKDDDPYNFDWNEYPFNFKPQEQPEQNEQIIKWSDYKDYLGTPQAAPENYAVNEQNDNIKAEIKFTLNNDDFKYEPYEFPTLSNSTKAEMPFEYSLEQYFGDGAALNQEQAGAVKYPSGNQYNDDYNNYGQLSHAPSHSYHQDDQDKTNPKQTSQFKYNSKDFPNYQSESPYDNNAQYDENAEPILQQTGPITFPPYMGVDKNKTSINITSTFKFLKENNTTVKPIVKMNANNNSNVSGFLSSSAAKANTQNQNNYYSQDVATVNNTNYLAPSQLPNSYNPYENNPTLSRLAAAVALGNIAHIKELAEKLKDDVQSSPVRYSNNKRKNIYSSITPKKNGKNEATSTAAPYIAPKLRTQKTPARTSTISPSVVYNNTAEKTTSATKLSSSTTTTTSEPTTPTSTSAADADETTTASTSPPKPSSSTTVAAYIAPKLRTRVVRKKVRINLTKDDIPV